MKDLEIFRSEEFGEVLVIIENNKEYFEAVKVALDHCKNHGVTNRDVVTVRAKRADGDKISTTTLVRVRCIF